MAGSTKIGGGINGMHLSNDAHPFSKGPFRGTSKFAKTVGMSAAPGGDGDKISANSARKKVPGSINGAGVAK